MRASANALLIATFLVPLSTQPNAQGVRFVPTTAATLLDPSLENQASTAIVVGCIMLGERDSSIAVHPSSELLDKRVRTPTPFFVRPIMGARCQLRGYRCVSGVAKISSYNPNFTATNSNLPGQIFVDVHIEAVSRRDCG